MFRCCASPPSEVVVHNVVTFTQVQTVKYKDYTGVRACTRQAHDLHKRLSVCSAKSHTSQLNLPGLQNIGGPTDQVCVRQEKSVGVQCAIGMQICCASQQELRSTERKSSTRITRALELVQDRHTNDTSVRACAVPRATHKSAVITAALRDNVHECVLDKNEESEKSCSWKYILWLVCNCCASQHKLRSTERKSSTRFTQTFGRVHRTKAGEGPYGSSGISSLDRYYHR